MLLLLQLLILLCQLLQQPIDHLCLLVHTLLEAHDVLLEDCDLGRGLGLRQGWQGWHLRQGWHARW